MAIYDEKTTVENENEENNAKKEGKSSAFWQKASDLSKKAADGIQKGAKVVADKTKEDWNYRQKRKRNSLSVEEFNDSSFILPNIISIIDDASERDVDIENEMGYRTFVSDVEVLKLYDEWANKCGLKFVPYAKCDEVYCVDPFDRTRFIKADCVFAKANEEKLAELEHIAYRLGAKKCTIELVEKDYNRVQNSVSTKANRTVEYEEDGSNNKTKKKSETVKTSLEYRDDSRSTSNSNNRTTTTFVGSDNPVMPNLKWFLHDENMKGLIEMRCTEKNSVKSKTLELHGSSTVVMSKKMAIAIDKLMKVSGSLSMSIENQYTKEHSSKLIFEVEF